MIRRAQTGTRGVMRENPRRRRWLAEAWGADVGTCIEKVLELDLEDPQGSLRGHR